MGTDWPIWTVRLRRALDEVLGADPASPGHTAMLEEAEELLWQLDEALPVVPTAATRSPCCTVALVPEFVGSDATWYRCACGARYRLAPPSTGLP